MVLISGFFFPCGCSVFQTPFVEEIFIAPLHIFSAFVRVSGFMFILDAYTQIWVCELIVRLGKFFQNSYNLDIIFLETLPEASDASSFLLIFLLLLLFGGTPKCPSHDSFNFFYFY